MQCPKCKLHNPDGAMRCDCGYDFDTKEMKDSYSSQQGAAPSAGYAALGWVFSVLGGWIGIVIACTIAFGKNGVDYKYDAKSRRLGKNMLALAIIMGVLWLLVGLLRH